MFLYTLRLVKASASVPISFQLADYVGGSPPALTKFVDDPDNAGQKLYGSYEIGNTCVMHDSQTGKNANLFVMLVIGKRSGDNNCQVERIVMNTGLVPCSGTTKPFWEILTLNQGNSQPDSFRGVGQDGNYISNHHVPLRFQITGFSTADLTDDIVEMGLLQPFYSLNSETSINVFWQTQMSRHNDQTSKNAGGFAKVIKPSKMIPRLIQDDLPGWYLGVYSGPTDDCEKYVQRVLIHEKKNPVSLHTLMYMSNPHDFTTEKTHIIEIESKPYKTKTTDSAVYVDYLYQIHISRTATHLTFSVHRAVSATGSTVNLPYTGSQDFVYFGFTVGQAQLIYTDETNLKAKFYETLVVFQGSNYLSDVQSHVTTSTIHEIMRIESTHATWRWNRVQYTPGAGVTTNEAGIRVYQMGLGFGVFPALLVSSRTNTGSYERCYYDRYNLNKCMAMALLKDSTETQYLKIVSSTEVKTVAASGDIGLGCKLPLTDSRCLSPKAGYMIDLETGKRTRVYGGIITEANYNALPQADKDFFQVFTSNTGTKYLVACDSSCKI